MFCRIAKDPQSSHATSRAQRGGPHARTLASGRAQKLCHDSRPSQQLLRTSFCLCPWLVVWKFGTCFIFHNIWDVILPIDELIFFKMVIAPPTSFGCVQKTWNMIWSHYHIAWYSSGFLRSTCTVQWIFPSGTLAEAGWRRWSGPSCLFGFVYFVSLGNSAFLFSVL